MLPPIVEECPGEIRIAVQHEHIFGIAILRCKREIKAAGYERWLFCIAVDDDHLVVGRRMIGVCEYRQAGPDQVLHRARLHQIGLIPVRNHLHVEAAVVGANQCICNFAMRKAECLHQDLCPGGVDSAHDQASGIVPRGEGKFDRAGRGDDPCSIESERRGDQRKARGQQRGLENVHPLKTVFA
jgi:hypothetical protein